MNLARHVGDLKEDVTSNRALASKEFGNLAFMNQVHGDQVVVVDSVSAYEPTADALVSAQPGVSLAVLVADCIPLLLWSDEVIAAVHVGRRGLCSDIALRTLEVMRALGAQEIRGAMGPSICGKCYEVGEDVYQQVVADYPAAASLTSRSSKGLDLAKALKTQLFDLGVSTTSSSRCTAEDASLFSYRRDGVTGRQAGIISL